MYLGAVNIRMADGSIQSVNNDDLSRIGSLLAQNGTPLRPDGLPFSVTKAFGGELWDGCPIQVATEEASAHMRNTWGPAQIEVMKGAGLVPMCLVSGSPNYSAFFGAEQVVPQSGTGTRRTLAPIIITNSAAPPALLPTGVSTPSVVPQPGGGAFYVPAESSDTGDVQQAGLVPESDSSWWPWILAALFIVPKVVGVGYVGHRYYKRRRAAR